MALRNRVNAFVPIRWNPSVSRRQRPGPAPRLPLGVNARQHVESERTAKRNLQSIEIVSHSGWFERLALRVHHHETLLLPAHDVPHVVSFEPQIGNGAPNRVRLVAFEKQQVPSSKIDASTAQRGDPRLRRNAVNPMCEVQPAGHIVSACSGVDSRAVEVKVTELGGYLRAVGKHETGSWVVHAEHLAEPRPRRWVVRFRAKFTPELIAFGDEIAFVPVQRERPERSPK